MHEFIKKQIIAQKAISQIIKKNQQTQKSGIYIYERIDENNVNYFYCGQAVNIYNRQVSHYNGFQRIDISIRKRGFFNENNPYGWKFKILEFCPEIKLNEREQYWILYNLKQGKQTYNLNYGGNKGKKNTFDKERKGYQQGKTYGYEKAREEVRVFFEKYLDFTIKGKETKTKLKKLEEFKKFIGE